MKSLLKYFLFYLILFTCSNLISCEEKYNMKRACRNIKEPENGERCSAARFYNGYRCCYVDYTNKQECEYLPNDGTYIREWALKIGATSVDCNSIKLDVSYNVIMLICGILFLF